MRAKEWIAAYSEQLGVEPPTADELKAILDLAAEAAHASERIAAPVACWLSREGGPITGGVARARAWAEPGLDRLTAPKRALESLSPGLRGSGRPEEESTCLSSRGARS